MSGAGTSTNPLVQFAEDIKAFFLDKEQEVIAFADKFLPQAEQDAEVAFDELATLAGQAVLVEAPKVLSGAEKFGSAVASVVQQVEAAGKTVAIQTAQMAVQQAYLTAQAQAQAAQ